MYTKKELIESLESLPDDKPIGVLVGAGDFEYSERLQITGVGSGDAFKDSADVIADSPSLSILADELISVANMMRGMSLDPGISQDRRTALRDRSMSIDKITAPFEA